jgi:antitoxin component YwqK of YwqJK toxin-antitoxin module
MRILLLTCLLLPLFSLAQYKSYKIGIKGDTLNATDMQGKKQGKWIVRLETVRGEPGYEEEGVFKDDIKEGIWRRYNLGGDIIAIENYKWGHKDGLSRYFTMMGPLRDETWRAINPENPYDTVEVPDPLDPYKVSMQVIKVEGSTVRHGVWRFYDASGGLARTETYFMGKLEDPNKKLLTATTAADSSLQVRKKLSDDSKPKEIKDYDKKNSGKKKIKVREGRVGGE